MSHLSAPHPTERSSRCAAAPAVLLWLIVVVLGGGPALAAPQQAQLSDFSVSIQETVQNVLPSVVQIITSGYAPLQAGSRLTDLLSRTQGGGSGVIVDIPTATSSPMATS